MPSFWQGAHANHPAGAVFPTRRLYLAGEAINAYQGETIQPSIVFPMHFFSMGKTLLFCHRAVRDTQTALSPQHTEQEKEEEEVAAASGGRAGRGVEQNTEQRLCGGLLPRPLCSTLHPGA